MKIKILLTFFFVSLFFVSQAAYFENVPRQLIQPNGDTLNCFATGDEYYHWLHDANGYTIVQNASTGYFVYANKVGNKLVPTSFIPNKINPASVGLRPGINISAQQHRQKRESMMDPVSARPALRDGNNNRGTLNNLVVFIRFSDDSEFSNSFYSVNNMFNDSINDGNSLYNYFKVTSYNQLFIKSTFYPVPSGNFIISYQDSLPRNYFEKQSITNPNGYCDTTNERTIREHALLQRAVDYIQSMVPEDLDIDYNNDDFVDNVCFVVKGSVADWSDLLWPHRWSLYSVDSYINGKRVYDYNFQLGSSSSYFTTSVLCHEAFHSLGAPDLYHYSDSLNFNPVGPWDLMGSNGEIPQQTNAYMKYKYGNWIDDIPEITQYGTYTLFPLNSATSEKTCYKIASENPDEFYLLEYRRNNVDNFDQSVPGSGVVIYRINTLFNGNAGFNNVDVLDEVYVYRHYGTPTNNGLINQAYFRANIIRDEFNKNTDPYPFLSDGTIGSLAIDSFTVAGDSIQFRYTTLEIQNIQELPDYQEIKVYPNPFFQYVEILIPDNLTNVGSVDIYDISGKLLRSQNISEQHSTISFENFASGIYFLNLRDKNNMVKSVKIIKK